MRTQCEQILELIRSSTDGITQRDAWRVGCSRLAAVVWTLKNKYGYPIKSKTEVVVKANGRRTSIARYYLEVKRDE